uniref:Uncharacterized protein n=1 Tax=Rhizophora mucronata TaxID=61149 RepID=A0A2P2N9A7_RHIMU
MSKSVLHRVKTVRGTINSYLTQLIGL